jgi:hypothetical protein
MFSSREQIQEALSRTGRRLALMGADDYSILICGGSALNLMGLISRPTRDVDVLGMIKGGEHAFVADEGLPEDLSHAASLVAADLNLPFDWLNDAALEIHKLKLPNGILERAEKRAFGPCLTVYIISRQDQVAFKLYAAIDPPKGQRHFKDLVAIKPTRREMEFAVHWLLDRPTSLAFRKAVQDVATTLGFAKLKVFTPLSET